MFLAATNPRICSKILTNDYLDSLLFSINENYLTLNNYPFFLNINKILALFKNTLQNLIGMIALSLKAN